MSGECSEIVDRQFTIQQALNELSSNSVQVSEITASMTASEEGVLEEPYWSLNNELLEGIISERWEPLTDGQKIDRLVEVIVLWPCYSTASFLPRLLRAGIDAKAEHYLWDQLVHLLDHPNSRCREAIEYVVWVDFFEDRSTSAKSWQGMMSANPSIQARKRLLANSGPVPYAAKRRHYQSLFENPDDHELLAECLARCLDDAFGDIDTLHAKSLVHGLQVEPTNKFVTFLRKSL